MRTRSVRNFDPSSFIFCFVGAIASSPITDSTYESYTMSCAAPRLLSQKGFDGQAKPRCISLPKRIPHQPRLRLSMPCSTPHFRCYRRQNDGLAQSPKCDEVQVRGEVSSNISENPFFCILMSSSHVIGLCVNRGPAEPSCERSALTSTAAVFAMSTFCYLQLACIQTSYFIKFRDHVPNI